LILIHFWYTYLICLFRGFNLIHIVCYLYVHITAVSAFWDVPTSLPDCTKCCTLYDYVLHFKQWMNLKKLKICHTTLTHRFLMAKEAFLICTMGMRPMRDPNHRQSDFNDCLQYENTQKKVIYWNTSSKSYDLK